MLAAVFSNEPKSGITRSLAVMTAISLVAAMLIPLSILCESKAWSTDPTVNTPVCTSVGNQLSPGIISDGSGGAIIIWETAYPSSDIYAQLVDSTGAPKWAEREWPSAHQ